MKKLIALFFVTALIVPQLQARQDWLVFEGNKGKTGPGKGKHIVLIAGDEEYRSEEAMPQLGKILATHHGFKCTVLFSIDEDTGMINPNNRGNIPGTEALKTADLMIIATRFRDLKDAQMKNIDDYLRRGGAVIGMRTATHAFNISRTKAYGHYGNGYGGDKKEWKDGFGRLVLGEKWISHHGGHKTESTVGILDPKAKNHPIQRGLKDGDIWGPTDVYGVRLPLPGDSQSIILGQVTKRAGARTNDIFFGMKPTDTEATPGRKNNPMMPVAWTKSYQLPGGKKGRTFATTMGSSTDLVAAGSRRMIVNGAYWLLDLEIPKGGTKVDIVGKFEPTQYSFRRGDYWPEKNLKPADFK